MIKDLNDIYEGPTGGGDGPGDPKPRKARPLSEYNSGPKTMATLSGTDPRGYEPYMPSGVHDERGGREGGLDSIRGANQSFGEQLGRRLGNLIPNIASDLVDMVGYTGALLTEWGDNRDYSNALNDIAAKMKNPLGEAYRSDNSTWAIGDSAWWLNNLFDTAEYAGAFAIGGTAVGKLLGAAGKGLSTAMSLGARSSRLLQGAMQLGTSGVVSYAEAAQAGAQVYQQTYNTQLQKMLASGMDPDEARVKAAHISAQSAATTAQLGTLLTMGLNTGAYAPLFRKSEDVAQEIIAKRLAQAENFSMADLGKAIRGMNAADYADKLFHHSALKDIAREMTGEGLEEFLQQHAQNVGEDRGKKGQELGFFEQFGELSTIIDKTANSEGALNFALGAAFGGLQHGLLHNIIPSKQVDRLDTNGNPVARYSDDGVLLTNRDGSAKTEKTWTTPRKYERDFTQKRFENIRDSIAADFEHQAARETELVEAVKKGDQLAADEARDNLFQPTALHAIKHGVSEPLIKTFEKIAQTDNTEVDDKGQTAAMRAGVATEAGTTDHADRAKEAIQGIKHLQQVYQRLQQVYHTKYEDNSHLEPYVDMVFARTSDLYYTQQRIQRYEKQLAENLKEEQAMAQIMDPLKYTEEAHGYLRQLDSAKKVESLLINDHKELLSADPKKVDRLLKKYRAIGFGDGSTQMAVKELDRRLRNKQEEVVNKAKEAEERMLASTTYAEWLKDNPKGSFSGYLKEVHERQNLSTANREMQAGIETAKAQYDIAQQHLQEMTREKNAYRFMKKMGEWQEKLRKEAEVVEKKKLVKLSQLAKDKGTLDRLQRIGLNKVSADYGKLRDQKLAQQKANYEQILRLQEELKATKFNPLKILNLKKEIARLTAENKRLGAESAEALLNQIKYRVPDQSPQQTQEKEAVTGEKNGVTTMEEEEEEEEAPVKPANTTATKTQEDEAEIMSTTPEEIMAEIMGASTTSQEGTQELATIHDELAEIEGASKKAKDVIEEYNYWLNHVHPAVKTKLEKLASDLVAGTIGFSLDLLNREIATNLTTQTEASNVLRVLQAYVEEVRGALEAPEKVEHQSIIEQYPILGPFAVHDGSTSIRKKTGETLTGSFSDRVSSDGEVITIQPIVKKEDGETLIMSPKSIAPSEVDAHFGPIMLPEYREQWDDIKGKVDRVALREMVLPTTANTNKNGNIKVALDMDDGRVVEYLLAFDTTKFNPEETPTVDLVPPDVPDTPEIRNTDPAIATVIPENGAYHGGLKIIEAATMGATATIGYTEGKGKDREGKTVYRKITNPQDLLRPASEEILVPGKLLPGTELLFEVDVDYDGPKHITDSLSWDKNSENVEGHEKGTDYLDEQGKIRTKTIRSGPSEEALSKQYLEDLGGSTQLRFAKPGDVLYDFAGNVYHVLSKKDRYGRSLEYTKNGQANQINPKTAGDFENRFATEQLFYKDPRPVQEKYNTAREAAKTSVRTVLDPHAVANIPIRVKDAKTGKFLFHMHSLEWIDAKFPGTTGKEEFRNVVKLISDGNGGTINNHELQREKLMQFREHIVRKFNSTGEPVTGHIGQDGKGTGRLILNWTHNGDINNLSGEIKPELAYNRKNPDKSMLPDTKLQLAIVDSDGGIPHTAHQYPTPMKLGFDPKDLKKGQVGALVPAANGQMMWAPMVGLPLAEAGKPSPALNSITRAVELYLLNNGKNKEVTKEIMNLEATTGFNVGTGKGLRSFINQFYTYTQKFSDSALSPNAKTGIAAEKFLFSIDDNAVMDKTKQIKVGFSQRGDGATYANLVNGMLDPSFVQKLEEGLRTRSRAVVFSKTDMGLKGINSSGKFHDATYVPEKGSWVHNEWENYNQYVKGFSRTVVYGRNQLHDDTYVYTANPHLPFDIPSVGKETTIVHPATTTTTIQQPAEAPKEYQAEANLFEDLTNFSLQPIEREVQAFGTGSDQSHPLNLKTLEDLYNFTPEAQRNGKTPLMVLEELTTRGHSYLSDGFNPFMRCL